MTVKMSLPNIFVLKQDALSRLSSQAAEIRQGVLAYFVQNERLLVKETALDADASSSPQPRETFWVTFDCEADRFVHIFPNNIVNDYWGLRSLSWLKSETLFTSPYDFYMSHYMLSNDPDAALPLIHHVPSSLTVNYPLNCSDTTAPILKTHSLLHDKNYPDLSHHGLERIILDFDAAEYVSLFSVYIPPFDDIKIHKDQHLLGAATLLQHCKELTIIFGESYRSAHPWYNLTDDQWNPDAIQRMDVCEKGDVVDWIFEYAWENAYLQHITKINIQGTVQTWVREKWEKIFMDWNEAKKNDSTTTWQDIHKADFSAIQTRGFIHGQTWDPEIHYPPTCKCSSSCSKLDPLVQVWEPSQNTSWDQYEVYNSALADWEISALADENDLSLW